MVLFSEVYHKRHHRLFWLTGIIQLLLCLAFLWIVPLQSPYVDFKMACLGILCPGMYYKPLKFLYTLYIIIPVLLLMRIIIKFTLEETGLIHRVTLHLPASLSKVLFPVIPLLVIGLLILVCRFSFSKTDKDAVLIHFYAAGHDWESVLKTSAALSTTDRTVLFQINRALYHLDRLPDQAFSYAQYWGENGLILTSHYSHDVLMFCSDLYFDGSY